VDRWTKCVEKRAITNKNISHYTVIEVKAVPLSSCRGEEEKLLLILDLGIR
jgi:hypothetical protein